MSCKIKLHIFSERATARHTELQRGAKRRWVVPELCPSRSIYSIQWHYEYSRALAKWLKHSRKHSNKPGDKELLAWQAIGDRCDVTKFECKMYIYVFLHAYMYSAHILPHAYLCYTHLWHHLHCGVRADSSPVRWLCGKWMVLFTDTVGLISRKKKWFVTLEVFVKLPGAFLHKNRDT